MEQYWPGFDKDDPRLKLGMNMTLASLAGVSDAGIPPLAKMQIEKAFAEANVEG